MDAEHLARILPNAFRPLNRLFLAIARDTKSQEIGSSDSERHAADAALKDELEKQNMSDILQGHAADVLDNVRNNAEIGFLGSQQDRLHWYDITEDDDVPQLE